MTNISKRCLLVGAAPCEHKGLDAVLGLVNQRKLEPFDVVFAVDGGYETLIKRGITPTLVFGDFDSLGYVPQHPGLIQFDSHKDFTDLDLALAQALEEGIEEAYICDALSARLDHSLGNLQLLIAYAARGMKVWGLTEEEVVAPLIGQSPFNTLYFDEGLTGVVSVLSHSDTATGVTEEGLEYTLSNATCINRALWGISNELTGDAAHITVNEGTLWVFFPQSALGKVSYHV